MTAGRVQRIVTGSVAAILLLAGLVSGSAVSQQTAATPDSLQESYGPWMLSCKAERSGCHMFQALYRAKDKARLVQVTVFAPTEPDAEPTMRALVPLGATLSHGAVIQVDGADPLTVPFRACWPRGCVAELTLTPVLEASMRAGTTLAVSIEGADTGRTIRLELALDGFGAALDRLRGL